jgi:hypothetical protein
MNYMIWHKNHTIESFFWIWINGIASILYIFCYFFHRWTRRKYSLNVWMLERECWTTMRRTRDEAYQSIFIAEEPVGIIWVGPDLSKRSLRSVLEAIEEAGGRGSRSSADWWAKCSSGAPSESASLRFVLCSENVLQRQAYIYMYVWLCVIYNNLAIDASCELQYGFSNTSTSPLGVAGTQFQNPEVLS